MVLDKEFTNKFLIKKVIHEIEEEPSVLSESNYSPAGYKSKSIRIDVDCQEDEEDAENVVSDEENYHADSIDHSRKTIYCGDGTPKQSSDPNFKVMKSKMTTNESQSEMEMSFVEAL